MRSLLSVLALLCLPGPALACTYPLVPEVNDEPPALRTLRQERFLREWSDEGSRLWQASRFDRATRIILGRVIRRRDLKGLIVENFRTVIDRPPLYEADILPIASLRGDMPTAPLSISYQLEMQCRFFEPGKAASADVGTPVLLFEVDGALDGFPVFMARDARLIAALKPFSALLETVAK